MGSDAAAVSLLMVYAAMACYAIALVAFAVDLSQLGALRAARTAVAVGGGANAGTSVAGESDAEETTRPARRRWAGVGVATTWLGFAFQLVAVIARGVAAGRPPWANMYEFCLTFTLVAVGAFLAVGLRRDIRFLGAAVVGPALLVLGLAVSVLYVAADGVQPALQSYWLVIHVSLAIAAAGVLSVAAGFAVVQLLQLRRAGHEEGRLARLLAALPDAPTLERYSFRLNAIGFVLWTFTLIAGSIWAQHAWNRFWGWDPKEVMTLVVWLGYVVYLHARLTRGWDGARAAVVSLIAYALLLFNFFGVNILFPGLHSYSGL